MIENIKKNYKIFVVDDEATVTMLIKIILEKAGYKNITTFNNPEIAYKTILTEKPDVVCSDIRMPNMTGIELLKKVKQELPNIFFIMISASSEFDDVLNCMQNGAYDYIPKPINRESLTLIVNKVIDILYLQQKNEMYITKTRTELNLAHDILMKLTPPLIKEFGNFSINFNRRYSSQIGGDFIEGHYCKNHDKFIILIADMPGHGISAALILSAFKAIANDVLRADDNHIVKSSGEILTLLNKNLIKLNLNVYPTACCLILDKNNNSIEYSNAGHPYPFIIHSSKEPTIFKDNEMLLGVTDFVYSTKKIELNEGDKLILYSDGITEINDKIDNMLTFGFYDFVQFIEKNKQLQDGILFSELFSKLSQIHGSTDFDDDIMLLTISLSNLK